MTGNLRVEQGRRAIQGRGAGWSGPSAIGTGGAGFGFQVGAEVTEYVMVLNTDAAVKAVLRGGNVTLEGDVSVAAGPVGCTASVAVTPGGCLQLQPPQGAVRRRRGHRHRGCPAQPSEPGVLRPKGDAQGDSLGQGETPGERRQAARGAGEVLRRCRRPRAHMSGGGWHGT